MEVAFGAAVTVALLFSAVGGSGFGAAVTVALLFSAVGGSGFGAAVTVALLFSAVGGSGFGSGLQFLGPLSAESVSQTLGPFTNDRRRLCITMPITDDEMCGESHAESFSVQLTTDDPNITLTPASATLVVRDSPQCSETVCLVRKPVIYMYS